MMTFHRRQKGRRVGRRPEGVLKANNLAAAGIERFFYLR